MVQSDIGCVPTFDDYMVQELADAIAKLARRGGGRGMRIDFEFICDALEGDEELTRAVLQRAGGRRCPEQWAIGKGNSLPAHYTYPEVFAERLTDILGEYEA